MALSVDVRTTPDGFVVITLRGELDLNTVEQLRDAVAAALAARPTGLRLDVAFVTFIDSSGLGAIVTAHKACAGLGCRITLEGVNPALYQRLHVSGLTDLFGLAPPPA